MKNLPQISLLTSPDWKNYALLDSGDGRKLEKFGQYVLIRPEAEAIWKPTLNSTVWAQADAEFIPTPEKNGGHWVSKHKMEDRWPLAYKGLQCWLQTTASRHVGVFPEQAEQWDWIASQVKMASKKARVLNLFGYTGMASLAAVQAGAEVTHVDASQKTLNWGKENQALSGLGNDPIRWLLDDAFKFVLREQRRGSQYDGIILDPPKFGRGPKGEVWEFYKILPNLLATCAQILSPQPQFVLLTAYAVKASALTLYYAVNEIMSKHHGTTTIGEVLLQEQSKQHAISMAIYARWSRVQKSGASNDN